MKVGPPGQATSKKSGRIMVKCFELGDHKVKLTKPVKIKCVGETSLLFLTQKQQGHQTKNKKGLKSMQIWREGNGKCECSREGKQMELTQNLL